MTVAAYGVEELDAYVLEEVVGGGGGGFLGKAFALYMVKEIVDNWGDIKDGLSDGWNGTYR